MLQGMPYLALTIHSPNPETAKTNSHPQKNQNHPQSGWFALAL